MINAVDDFFGYDEYPRDAAAVLLIELDGQVAEVQASAERAEQLCRHAGARGLRLAQDPTECAVLWKGRKSAFSAVGKIKRRDKRSTETKKESTNHRRKK